MSNTYVLCEVCGEPVEFNSDGEAIDRPDCGMMECPNTSSLSPYNDELEELNFNKEPVSNLDREIPDPWSERFEDYEEGYLSDDTEI